MKLKDLLSVTPTNMKVRARTGNNSIVLIGHTVDAYANMGLYEDYDVIRLGIVDSNTLDILIFGELDEPKNSSPSI